MKLKPKRLLQLERCQCLGCSTHHYEAGLLGVRNHSSMSKELPTNVMRFRLDEKSLDDIRLGVIVGPS